MSGVPVGHGDARNLQKPPFTGYFEDIELREPWSARIAELAADQWGLVTRRQLEQLGVPPTTLDRFTAPRGGLVRVAFGVYLLRGAPEPDHLDPRAAWLQLAPGVPVWERTPAQGVISHRSAATVYGIGHLPADVHEFTVPVRKQTRRADVRLYVRSIGDDEIVRAHGLPLTRPSRIAADLLRDREDPEAIAQIIADAITKVFDYPGTFADSLAPYAHRFRFAHHDGVALLRWFLDLAGARDADRWVDEAREQGDQRWQAPTSRTTR